MFSWACLLVLPQVAALVGAAAVTLGFGLSMLLFVVTIPGKFFTGFIMEIIGRRSTITYCFADAIPGLALTALAHRTGD
jgi:MFS family permease